MSYLQYNKIVKIGNIFIISHFIINLKERLK
jgi:hypothetical protein